MSRPISSVGAGSEPALGPGPSRSLSITSTSTSTSTGASTLTDSPRREKLAAELKQEAYRLGFDLVGVTSAEPFHESKELVLRRHQQGFLEGLSWITAERIKLSGEPLKLLPSARSIVAVAMSYLSRQEAVGQASAPAPLADKDARPPVGTTARPRGRVARYAWGEDYHKVLREKMKLLLGYLRNRCQEPVDARLFVDTGPCLDRAVAQRAGLGFIGKNTNLLTRGYGSWIFLGEMLVSVDLEPDLPMEKDCGRCTACIDACPTGALNEPYGLDSRLCISYLTIEHKGTILPALRPLMGNHVFGCDICQEVCPWNRRPKADLHPEFAPSEPLGPNPPLIPLLNLSQESYSAVFKGSPIKRARRSGLRRNVAVALGNSGDPAAVPALGVALADPDPLVRGHAAWALGAIGGPEARRLLQEAARSESDPMVQDEIRSALQGHRPGEESNA